jgi:hypothetical protein
VTVGADGYTPETMTADVYLTVTTAAGADALPLMVGHSLGGTIVSVYGHSYPMRGILDIDQSMDLLSMQVFYGRAEERKSGGVGEKREEIVNLQL